MNETTLTSIKHEINDEDAEMLFSWLVHEYWELPRKWLSRAAKALNMDIKRADKAKRRLYQKRLIGPNGYGEKAYLVIKA